MFNFKTLGDIFQWQKKQEELRVVPPQPEPAPEPKPEPKARKPRKPKEIK
jgi:hypothetical protein